jgi:hypothetical protein
MMEQACFGMHPCTPCMALDDRIRSSVAPGLLGFVDARRHSLDNLMT